MTYKHELTKPFVVLNALASKSATRLTMMPNFKFKLIAIECPARLTLRCATVQYTLPLRGPFFIAKKENR